MHLQMLGFRLLSLSSCVASSWLSKKQARTHCSNDESTHEQGQAFFGAPPNLSVESFSVLLEFARTGIDGLSCASKRSYFVLPGEEKDITGANEAEHTCF